MKLADRVKSYLEKNKLSATEELVKIIVEFHKKEKDRLLTETNEKTRKILVWYSNKGGSADITELLTERDKLASLSYYLAEQAGNRFIEYNNYYFLRVIHVAKDARTLAKGGLSWNQAEPEAKVKHQELIETEKDAEGAAFLADKLLRQVNKILDAMNQRIAYIKQEIYQANLDETP